LMLRRADTSAQVPHPSQNHFDQHSPQAERL
jgi:hypothetical protein